MPHFQILIDDGEMIASDADTNYKDMDAAVTATINAALHIAGDRASWSGAHQLLRCEVRERGTEYRREVDVYLRGDDRRAVRPTPAMMYRM